MLRTWLKGTPPGSRRTKPRRTGVRWTSAVVAALALCTLVPGASNAQNVPFEFAHPAFKSVWARADYPVYARVAERSWLWGPGPLTSKMEPMAQSPGGTRLVQYFDKARMEINNPNADPDSPWFVTNGLLVYEMVSGRMQVGENQFEQREPARIPVAGDVPPMMNPVNITPWYASLARVATLAPGQNEAQPRVGQEVVQFLSADGTVSTRPPQMGPAALPKIQYYEPTTHHNIPNVFWSFMNQTGTVYEGGRFVEGRQLMNWVYTMGYPLTEPYWIDIYIVSARATIRTTVMMQAFQRRVLTYNPSNPPGWQVEMGNVGLHYYQWRYGSAPAPSGGGGNMVLNIRRLDTGTPFASGQYSAIHDPLYTAIATPDEWQKLWERHTADFDGPTVLPQVDFSKEFVVGAWWGDKPNGCYTLRIQSVAVSGSTITVTVSQTVRQGGCTQVIVQPNDIVAVSRAGLTHSKYSVVFVDTNGNTLARGEVTLR